MATVPIVTEVTKAELDALVAANGLNEGLQYKVTDKDWLLVATSENSLTPIIDLVFYISESILLEIPEYISTNNFKIKIETTSDLSIETGVPIQIQIGNSVIFIPSHCIFYGDEIEEGVSIHIIAMSYSGEALVNDKLVSSMMNSVFAYSGFIENISPIPILQISADNVSLECKFKADIMFVIL